MKTNCHDCCYPEIIDNKACGCCEGVEPLTPLPTANRPGLSQLAYRIGSHASFLETMIAHLSSNDYPQLAGLTTRNADDPSIALLDGWATVADVLTFYQERIANEGYLRTATERRSVLELVRLVGYQLRPGVSSSVFLAYTIDENTEEETTIPAGSRAQSVPGPGELPQSFETSDDLKARVIWNNLKPRMTQPQTSKSIDDGLRVYLKGISTNLKPNDPLLVQFGTGIQTPYRILEVKPDPSEDHTLVMLQAWASPTVNPVVAGSANISNSPKYDDIQLIKDLVKSPSLQPPGSTRLTRQLKNQFKLKSESGYTSVSTFTPVLSDILATAAANANVGKQRGIKIYAMQIKAAPFGHNLALPINGECIPKGGSTVPSTLSSFRSTTTNVDTNTMELIALDAEYNNIKVGAWAIVERNGVATTLRVEKISTMTLGGMQEDGLGFFSTCPPITTTNNSISISEPPKMRSTVLKLSGDWRNNDDTNMILRNTTLYAQSEELVLAEEPIETAVCGGAEKSGTGLLELDGFYEGLESGRWVIVSGEREIEGTSGVRFSELAMLASVTQDIRREAMDADYTNQQQSRPGEKIHTFIKLANELAYCFKRDTVTIYGNVVKATHGETRKEVLGSGDGSKALQSFELKQFPLTHVSASNPSGVNSTLEVSVNDIQWHETDSLAGLQSTDRLFVTKTDDDSKTSIIFGNGREGARLPTGVENIRAEYRNGIGKGGNVKAEQISLLASKPLGVKEVINPLRASGGADRENRDQARKSAPLAVMALDRLVSVRDYKDFSRLYAGIGKSDAVEITDGRRQRVHVTIAGADDIPIDENSDLFINLRQALHDFGDPYQPIQLAIRELMFIVISANIKIYADYQWEPVVINLRAALLHAFGFEQRELGQDAVLSEVMSVMQAVPGVVYVDVDVFGGIPEKIAEANGTRRLLTPDEIAEHVQDFIGEPEQINRPERRLEVNLAGFEQGVIRPAQLAFLTPDVPDTLILNQIK